MSSDGSLLGAVSGLVFPTSVGSSSSCSTWLSHPLVLSSHDAACDGRAAQALPVPSYTGVASASVDRQQNPPTEWPLVGPQEEDGPCGVLAAVQCHVVRVVANCGSLEDLSVDEVMVRALANILEGCMTETFVSLAVLREPGPFGTIGEFNAHVQLIRVPQSDLHNQIKILLPQFMRSGGILLLVYSCIATRGVESLLRDVRLCAASSFSTMLEPSYSRKGLFCTQELVHLLLYGCALSDVSDDPSHLAIVYPPSYSNPPMASEIGIITQQSCVRFPRLPIWCVLCGGHYTALWCKDLRLTPSQATIRSGQRLELLHFNGLSRLHWTVGGAEMSGARLTLLTALHDEVWLSGKCRPSAIPPDSGVKLVDTRIEMSGGRPTFLFGVTVSSPKKVISWNCNCGRANPTANLHCTVCRSWSCSSCTIVNQSHCGSCQVCGSRKPPISTSSNHAAGNWSCSTCTFINASSSTACTLCGSERTPTPESNSRDWQDSTQWVCECCTSQNSPEADSCAVCDTPRSSSKKCQTHTKSILQEVARNMLPDIVRSVQQIWPSASIFCSSCNEPLPSLTS